MGRQPSDKEDYYSDNNDVTWKTFLSFIIDLLQVSTDINYLSDSEIPVGGGHFVLVVISKDCFLIPVSQSSSKMIEIRDKKRVK